MREAGEPEIPKLWHRDSGFAAFATPRNDKGEARRNSAWPYAEIGLPRFGRGATVIHMAKYRLP
jgi:hypothetical protein